MQREHVTNTPSPQPNVVPIGWVTVRVEDTCDGLLINADDMKRFGLRDDVQYEGHFLPDGRYRIAIPSPAPEKHVAGLIEAARDVIASASDTYKKRNGHLATFQDDSGEKCWIVPFDAFEGLRSAVSALATTEGKDNG